MQFGWFLARFGLFVARSVLFVLFYLSAFEADTSVLNSQRSTKSRNKLLMSLRLCQLPQRNLWLPQTKRRNLNPAPFDRSPLGHGLGFSCSDSSGDDTLKLWIVPSETTDINASTITILSIFEQQLLKYPGSFFFVFFSIRKHFYGPQSYFVFSILKYNL